MTPSEVTERVSAIRELRHDDERAHSEEIWLRHDVLRAIANGADNPAQLAVEALKTSDIDFSRWTA